MAWSRYHVDFLSFSSVRSQRSIQNELIFRLLLKVTVDWSHSQCDSYSIWIYGMGMFRSLGTPPPFGWLIVGVVLALTDVYSHSHSDSDILYRCFCVRAMILFLLKGGVNLPHDSLEILQNQGHVRAVTWDRTIQLFHPHNAGPQK
jgi:hypothetical protein